VNKLPALTAVAGAAAALAVPALAATKTVTVGDDYFVRAGAPPTVVVKKGDTVKWIWRGKHRHNVFQVGGQGHFHSPTRTSGTFKHRFTIRGSYRFQCTYHANMKMNVKVK
jgi:plastocyanin